MKLVDLTIEIRNFRVVDHRTIKANFNIYVVELDLYLSKMTLMDTAKGKFVSPPSEKYEKDGATNYFPYWALGKDSSREFQDKIMGLLQPLLSPSAHGHQSGQGQQDYAANDDLPF
jgi:hypothetical protein